MDNCCLSTLCGLLSQINWLWYILSVIVVFLIGALWYLVLFSKAWIKAFDIKMPAKEEMKSSDMILPMLIQFIATALMGLFIFILTPISGWLSIFAIIAFGAWIKATIKFHVMSMKKYIVAAGIEAGYYAVAVIVFILFAML